MVTAIGGRVGIDATNERAAIVPIQNRTEGAPELDTAQLDALYALMKAEWDADPAVDGKSLIQLLGEFVAEDGTQPFLSLKLHTAVFGEMMARLQQDGGADLPVYEQLREAQWYSLVGAGVLDQFIVAMLTREDPEPW